MANEKENYITKLSFTKEVCFTKYNFYNTAQLTFLSENYTDSEILVEFLETGITISLSLSLSLSPPSHHPPPPIKTTRRLQTDQQRSLLGPSPSALSLLRLEGQRPQ